MEFLISNLLVILVVLFFIVSGILRLVFSKRRSRGTERGKRRSSRMKIPALRRSYQAETSVPVKPDDERRLKFEKIEESRYIGFQSGYEEEAKGIGVLEGRRLDEEKLDAIDKRKLETVKPTSFDTEKLTRIQTKLKPVKWEEMGEVVRKKLSIVERLNRLKPFSRAIVWKEILDRPKSERTESEYF